MVRTGDRVRIRIGNLTMTNHPIHLHGHDFEVTGTDGGWVPKAARWPEVTTDVAVGQMRAIEFVADNPGDWAFHCHKSHHTMNAMGHDVPTMIGVDHRGVAEKITKLVPDYMVMGERGMADMGEMEMPLPDNTLPMMTGSGPVRRRWRWAACSPSSRCATDLRAATTRTRAGTSTRRARSPTSGPGDRAGSRSAPPRATARRQPT